MTLDDTIHIGYIGMTISNEKEMNIRIWTSKFRSSASTYQEIKYL